MYNTMNNPSAHPSLFTLLFIKKSQYTVFFFFCTSYCFLHILLFFCTSYCLLHILLFFGTSYCFALFLFHCTFYSYFSFSYHMYALVLCYLYNLYSYYFALSTERTWFDYISLLIIPCITIMWQIKKPWTLNLTKVEVTIGRKKERKLTLNLSMATDASDRDLTENGGPLRQRSWHWKQWRQWMPGKKEMKLSQCMRTLILCYTRHLQTSNVTLPVQQ